MGKRQNWGSTPKRGGLLDIGLPGFVQSRSSKLKESFRPTGPGVTKASDPPPGLVAPKVGGDLEAALTEVSTCWLTLYGHSPSGQVPDAASQWIAHYIWAYSDLAEGQPFAWNQVDKVMFSLSPSWPVGEPNFARVMVAAGMLEDPFGGESLRAQPPTLIRRFVHRFRTQTPTRSLL